ncbi:MAG: UDP-N-acetylmuramoyl-tripeptide--D-alanyl-D-alanine ligase [Candidatus Hydrothermia bacterium]
MFTIREIAHVIRGKLRNANPNLSVHGFTTDSRSVTPNSIFFAIKGEKHNGLDFAKEAVEKGAIAVVAPYGHGIEIPLPLIEVDDTVLAMARLAKYKLSRVKSKIIGITGSVGKTTTKELIFSLLATKYKVFKSKKSYNNHIGLPLTILEMKEPIDYLILEYGTNHPGEIAYLTSIAKPDIAIITKIGTAHIEYFFTQENIALEKGKIFEDLKPGGTAFVNSSTPYFDIIYKRIPYTARKITYGLTNGDVKPDFYETTPFGTTFNYKGTSFYFPLPGKGMLENAIGALAVAEHLNVPLTDIASVLRDFRDEKMRMEKKEIKDIIFVNDAYNANPDSMMELLETFKDLNTRRIFILGDMLELGDKAEEEHKKVGKKFAEMGYNILITYGSLARLISEEAQKLGVEMVFHFETKDEIVFFLKEFLKPGDWVILKASRGMALEDVEKKLEEIL